MSDRNCGILFDFSLHRVKSRTDYYYNTTGRRARFAPYGLMPRWSLSSAQARGNGVGTRLKALQARARGIFFFGASISICTNKIIQHRPFVRNSKIADDLRSSGGLSALPSPRACRRNGYGEVAIVRTRLPVRMLTVINMGMSLVALPGKATW